MKNPNLLTSTCRHCCHYVPEGRRGGHCQKLSVSVQSGWKACSLANPPFEAVWERLEERAIWQQQKTIVLQEVTMSHYSIPNQDPDSLQSGSWGSSQTGIKEMNLIGNQ